MKATEILKEEHQVISNTINDALRFLDTENWHDLKYWTTFLHFLKSYADDYHHAKEEDIYFLWMRSKEPDLENGPLRCMLGEHDKSREIVDRASLTLQKVQGGDEESWEQFKIYVYEYAQILLEHIDKENNILYKMAEKINDVHGDGDLIMLPLFENAQEKN